MKFGIWYCCYDISVVKTALDWLWLVTSSNQWLLLTKLRFRTTFMLELYTQNHSKIRVNFYTRIKIKPRFYIRWNQLYIQNFFSVI